MSDYTDHTSSPPMDEHSKSTYTSFAVMMMGMNAVLFITLQQYPFFYETRIGLDVRLMTLGGIIYTIWDMFNDPLIGHYSDKNYGFTKNRGKRFPWIVGSVLPLVFVLILLFSPPSIDQYGEIVTFLWFIFFLAIYDGLTSAILVNYNSLLPVKFQSDTSRRNVSTLVHLFMMLGPFVGLILVSVIVTSQAASFQTLAIALGVFLIASSILSIRGLHESDDIKQGYLLEERSDEPFFTEFKQNFSQAMNEKEFRILALVTVSITITTSLIAVSTPYYAQYVYGVAEEDLGDIVAQVSFPFVLTTILGIPFYFWIIKQKGHLKSFKYALLLSPLPLILIFFSYTTGSDTSLGLVMLGAAIWGICGGILQISRIPVQADFFDVSATKYNKRQEGMYFGLWSFFSRIVTVIMLGILAIIHTVTNFDADKDNQTTEAIWGIMTHFGLIPAFFMIIAGIVFVKYWDLEPIKLEVS